MFHVLRHPYLLWLLLALPSIPMMGALMQDIPDGEGRPAVEFLLHPTGEFAARFMIIAMIATPVRLLFPSAGFSRWLVRHRRHFGVASFMYAVLHTILYVADKGALQPMLSELWKLGIWTGWLAMLIFLPLGLTSNDASVRRLGQKWKLLQRLVYIAACATLVHWIFVNNNIGAAMAHFVPLALLECHRIWRAFTNTSQKRNDVTSTAAGDIGFS